MYGAAPQGYDLLPPPSNRLRLLASDGSAGQVVDPPPSLARPSGDVTPLSLALAVQMTHNDPLSVSAWDQGQRLMHQAKANAFHLDSVMLRASSG